MNFPDSGLDAFTVQDLCHPTRLTETVLDKIHQLPPGRFAHERLEHDVRLLLRLIGDAVCGNYRRLRLTALADFLRALHYFLKVYDRRPDTWEGGYVDDLEEVVKVLDQHQNVIAEYREWSNSTLRGQLGSLGSSSAAVISQFELWGGPPRLMVLDPVAEAETSVKAR